MAVYVKALGISTKTHRIIPYRVTIGRFSVIFTGTARQLHDYIDSVRPIISELA
jgi:hypothetical protein